MAALRALKDKELCQRAKSGDSNALDTLFTEARPLIRSRIWRVIGYGQWPPSVDREDAEQEAAEALLKALRSWDGVRPLTTLAVTCIDRALRRWRGKTFPIVHVPENVYSKGQYHEKMPLSLNADHGRSLLEVLAGGKDPLDILTARCSVEVHRLAEGSRGRPATGGEHMGREASPLAAGHRVHGGRGASTAAVALVAEVVGLVSVADEEEPLQSMRYDHASERWVLEGRALHCGDGLEIKVGDEWLPVRIEHDQRHGWVLYTDGDTARILPSRRLPARLE